MKKKEVLKKGETTTGRGSKRHREGKKTDREIIRERQTYRQRQTENKDKETGR